VLGPDTLLESSNNDAKLAVGVSQALAARDYLRSNGHFLAKHVGGQPAGPIEALVVSRGLEGTGFLGQQSVPVITERAFCDLVRDATDLQRLWRDLQSRPDQQHAAAQTAELRSTIRLCGYEFVVPGLAVAIPHQRS